MKNWMADEKEEVLKCNEELKAEMSRVREENKSLAKSNEDLQSQMTKQEEENSKLKEGISKQRENRNTEFTKMKNYNEELKSVVVRWSEENETLGQLNEELKHGEDKMREEYDALSAKFEVLVTEKAALAQRNTELRLGADKMRQEYDALKSEMNKMKQEHNINLGKKVQDLKELHADENEARGSQIDQVMKLRDQYRDQSETLKREKYKLKIVLVASESQITQREASERNKDTTIADIRQQLQTKMELLDNAETRIEDWGSLFHKCKSEFAKMFQEMASTITTLEIECDKICLPCPILDCARARLYTSDIVTESKVNLSKELHNLNEIYKDLSKACRRLYEDQSEGWKEEREASERKRDTIADQRQQMQTMAESLSNVKAQNAELERKLARASASASSSSSLSRPISTNTSNGPARGANPGTMTHLDNRLGACFCVRCRYPRGSEDRRMYVSVPGPRNSEPGTSSSFSSSSARSTGMGFRGINRSRKRKGSPKYVPQMGTEIIAHLFLILLN